MRALITGVAGFAGSYLAEELLASGHEVAGTVFPNHSCENIKSILNKVKLFALDILDQQAIEKAIQSFAPDVVFHLAAISFVPDAESVPRKVFQTNFIGTLNILEAICKLSDAPHLIFVSSREIYGQAEFALTEECPANPQNFYALSKYFAELTIKRYQNIKYCIFRPFNHIGPRQRANFVVSSIARQIALMEKGKQDRVLEVGNIEVARDFTDVRDIVKAYRIAAENRVIGTYNLCSGRAVKIRKIVDMFKSLAMVEFEVRVKKELFRRHEVLKSFGSYEKAKRTFGWEPKIPLEKSLGDTLDFWRKQI